MKKQKSLLIPFFFSLVCSLFGTLFLPFLPAQPFSPFLAKVCLFRSKATALWIGAICGFITDLICSNHRFGFYALSFGGSVALLHRYKRYCLENHLLSVPLLTSIIAIALACFEWMTIRQNVSPFLRQIPLLALNEFLYAIFWFTLPEKLYNYLKRINWKEKLRKVIPKRFRSIKL